MRSIASRRVRAPQHDGVLCALRRARASRRTLRVLLSMTGVFARLEGCVLLSMTGSFARLDVWIMRVFR